MLVHKNFITGAAIGVVCFCLAGCASTSKRQDLILNELKGIHATLNTITNQLTQQGVDRQKVLSFSSKYHVSTRRDVNVEKLADITLPDNASKEEVNKYIEKIQAASEGQRTFSFNDPQIEMYSAVGKENLPLLISALSAGPYGLQSDFHIIPAISQLADESSKSLIIEALPAHHGLVQVVQNKGWGQDAHDILLSELKKGQRVSANWVQAVALLNDPASYPLLREYFINAGSSSSTYKVIKDLPIQDLPGAVAEAWKKCQFENEYERQRMAAIAAKYGHLDALSYLIDTIKTPPNHFSNYMQKQLHLAVFKVTGVGGSSDEQVAWYEANKDHLQFDPTSRRFVIAPETKEKATP